MSTTNAQTEWKRLVRRSPLETRLADIADTWFPEAYASGHFELRRLYEIVGSGEDADHFVGFSWSGKTQAIESLRTSSAGALLPSIEESLEYEDARNSLCIGDNLEVMKLLQPAYFGRFKMAYLEPPYNTGGEFIYPDDPTDPIARYLALINDEYEADDGIDRGRHGAWLSMMLPRLFLVRNLLRDDGVVFVIIDDHEVHRLRLLMDEVFGEENFVCTFIWEKRYSPAPDAPDVGYVHENILCYRKSDSFEAGLLPKTDAQKGRYRNPDNDPRGPWKPADYTCRYTRTERPNLYYPITNPNTGELKWPKQTRVWACSREEHEKNVEQGLVWWPESAEMPAKKRFLNEVAPGAKPRTFLASSEVGHTDEATKELRDALPDVSITPKPTRLLRHLIRVAGVAESDLILDPFARVGSIAAACSSMDEEDPMPRFVSIEFPERAGDHDLAELAKRRAVLSCEKSLSRLGGCRIFRLAEAGIKRWRLSSDASQEELDAQIALAIDPIDANRSDDEILAEIALEAGASLTDIPLAASSDGKTYEIPEAGISICLMAELDRQSIARLMDTQMTRLFFLDSSFGEDENLRLFALGLAEEMNKVIRLV